MNKKQMLKEQKRIKQERRDSEKMFMDDNGTSNLIKISLGVLLFIGVAFCGMNIINGNWNIFNIKNREGEEINSQMVLAGTMFNKLEEEYLVLAYDMSDKENSLYSHLTEDYYGMSKLYYLDLSSGFNTSIIGDKTVISNDLSKLKLSGPTLLFINKDKITKSYQTEDEIVNYFKNI